jgi:ketosteroid isomerase-like protein
MRRAPRVAFVAIVALLQESTVHRSAPERIEALVDRETRAWNDRDVDALLALFHPDMVWAWPSASGDHDPVNWEMPMGRFDPVRWGQIWRELFSTHKLVHNQRQTVAVRVTDQGDGGFAVVDVDTLWRQERTAEDQHWLGRATKFYVETDGVWKMIHHHGLLCYDREMCP